ncbi:MAG TPA: TMEM175 family protein [Thermoanaerobaculia bacterium]|nr:TMEM175 family protein [Thermoanaerobaculia bacterium]
MDAAQSARGHGVSRIEGFSDAVFGFALTLLVVSLEVPRSFAELMATMEGFLAFAICFAMIVWVWREHFVFFRRFGLEDARTIFLNALLLFVVLFYVYPLKFLFGALVKAMTGLGPGSTPTLALGDGERLMVVYGLGFVAMFGALALLYAHAARLARRAGADALTRHDARAGLMRHAATASVGVLSIVLARVLPERLISFSGWIYGLLGPVHGLVGWRLGRRRARLEAAG